MERRPLGPAFMATLRGLAAEGATVTISPRQVASLDLLTEKAKANGGEEKPPAEPEGATIH
jgi:hypothetical protein